MNAIETYKHKGLTVEIHQDESPDSPRTWDNLGTMACFHSRYTLGDEQPNDVDTWLRSMLAEHFGDDDKAERFEETADATSEKRREFVDTILTELEKSFVILPLYLYDHSGITMNTTGFSCPWDSGQVGFIYVSKKKALEEWKRKKWSAAFEKRIRKTLIGEVETYDQYLTGDVYGYVIKDADGDDLPGNMHDSCWGFYGMEYCKEEAELSAEWIAKELKQRHAEVAMMH